MRDSTLEQIFAWIYTYKLYNKFQCTQITNYLYIIISIENLNVIYVLYIFANFHGRITLPPPLAPYMCRFIYILCTEKQSDVSSMDRFSFFTHSFFHLFLLLLLSLSQVKTGKVSRLMIIHMFDQFNVLAVLVQCF